MKFIKYLSLILLLNSNLCPGFTVKDYAFDFKAALDYKRKMNIQDLRFDAYNVCETNKYILPKSGLVLSDGNIKCFGKRFLALKDSGGAVPDDSIVLEDFLLLTKGKVGVLISATDKFYKENGFENNFGIDFKDSFEKFKKLFQAEKNPVAAWAAQVEDASTETDPAPTVSTSEFGGQTEEKPVSMTDSAPVSIATDGTFISELHKTIDIPQENISRLETDNEALRPQLSVPSVGKSDAGSLKSGVQFDDVKKIFDVDLYEPLEVSEKAALEVLLDKNKDSGVWLTAQTYLVIKKLYRLGWIKDSGVIMNEPWRQLVDDPFYSHGEQKNTMKENKDDFLYREAESSLKHNERCEARFLMNVLLPVRKHHFTEEKKMKFDELENEIKTRFPGVFEQMEMVITFIRRASAQEKVKSYDAKLETLYRASPSCLSITISSLGTGTTTAFNSAVESLPDVSGSSSSDATSTSASPV